MLQQWFYVSRSAVESTAEVQQIVRVSRIRNGEHGVTGLLVYSGEHFAQVIEGQAEDLAPIIDSIRRDPRHQIVWERPLTSSDDRWFGDWSMGYLYNDSIEDVLRGLDTEQGVPGLDELIPRMLGDLLVNERSRTGR